MMAAIPAFCCDYWGIQMVSRSRLSQLAELQEPAHIEQIIQAQQAIGYVFPQDYVDLLKTANGLRD